MAQDQFLPKEDSLTIMFWNLENFFDPRDSGKGSADKEFSSNGSRHWSWKKFDKKRNMIAKTILWIGTKYKHLPDIIGFAEVENSFVLWSLCSSDPLKKLGYRYIHFESPDHRGIDVGLLYRSSTMQVYQAEQVPLVRNNDTLATRAILRVRAGYIDGHDCLFLVNHHPSKFSGAKSSAGLRELAMRTMYDCCDFSVPILISMGDFNDTPDAPQMAIIDDEICNLGMSFVGKDEGSIRFGGRWQLIDFFFVSRCIADSCKMYICKPDFLLKWDSTHPGLKPFRTYSGPRYIGGVSDHLPVVLRCGNLL